MKENGSNDFLNWNCGSEDDFQLQKSPKDKALFFFYFASNPKNVISINCKYGKEFCILILFKRKQKNIQKGKWTFLNSFCKLLVDYSRIIWTLWNQRKKLAVYLQSIPAQFSLFTSLLHVFQNKKRTLCIKIYI